jgi:hypothetical protein
MLAAAHQRDQAFRKPRPRSHGREMRAEIGKEIGKAAMDALMKGLAAYSEKLDALEGN